MPKQEYVMSFFFSNFIPFAFAFASSSFYFFSSSYFFYFFSSSISFYFYHDIKLLSI